MKRVIIFSFLAIVIAIGGYFGYKEYQFYSTHVETEDAQTDGSIVPVNARVSGYIQHIYVDDNQLVKPGQVLVQIDTTDYVIKLHMAQTALTNAKATLDVGRANINLAEVSLHKAKQDYQRVLDLKKGGAATQKQLDDVTNALHAAQAQYAEANKKLDEIKTLIKQRQDQLDYAKQELTYTTVKAPIGGLVSKKDIEQNQLVQTGMPLMAITDVSHVFVTANFKETELFHIKVGQKVHVSIDAFPERQFNAHVASIAGATGAKYALLPPQNASGNFVKVVQRIPVKIEFDETQNVIEHIPLGLNVIASIDFTKPDSKAGKTNAYELDNN